MTTLTADLTKKFLGLSGEDWEWWTKKINEIIHTASNGSWLGSYAALKPINVDGTREMIRLAVHGKSKALHYVSTVGVFVSSQRQREGPYQEEEPLPPVCTLSSSPESPRNFFVRSAVSVVTCDQSRSIGMIL